MEVTDMEADSAYTGHLAKGCVQCRRGAKMVLFVTGLCPNSCFYCPVSEKKSGKDVIYANERLVTGTEREIAEQIIDEARLIDAEGTGITGGDPLAVADRTAGFIRTLKEEFGPNHHIHLYTTITSETAIRKVAEAGLDEIRFHPDESLWASIENTPYRDAVKLSLELGMDAGFEVPAIPGTEKEMLHLIEFAEKSGMHFVNLNELEFSDNNRPEMEKRGFVQKNEIDYGVLGSEEAALRVLRDSTANIPVHYCSASFKNSVQLRLRIRRRAENVAKKHDFITEDGTLVRGLITGGKPEEIVRYMKDEFGIPDDMITIDGERVYTASWILEDIFEDYLENFPAGLPFEFYIVEEYPTADRLEVERIPLP